MRLIVKNIGPIEHADIQLKKVNVFIGPQSSGKSTIAKIISFCTWLEKELLSEHGACFPEGKEAWRTLQSFHHMEGYFCDDSYICYEGENITYVLEHGGQTYTPRVPEGCNVEHISQDEHFFVSPQREVTPKVLYIPAERNFVARVPNLSKYNPENDSLTSFVVDWEEAKRKVRNLPLLDMQAAYSYNPSGQDTLLLDNGTSIPLHSGSSGLQSITPLLVLVEWVTKTIYEDVKPFSYVDKERIREMLQHIEFQSNDASQTDFVQRLRGFLQGKIPTHTQLVIEEPEQNLYPDTQCKLLHHLLNAINHGKNHRLVITTHSPYLLSYFNNMILAGRLVQQGELGRVTEVLGNDHTPVPSSSYAAYYVGGGGVKDIIDPETQLVDAEMLDQVSAEIESQFNQLLGYDD